MIIVYFDGGNKNSLSIALKFIKDTSRRELTYDTSRGMLNEKADVNIITREHIDWQSVQELSKVAPNGSICMIVSQSKLAQYRSGEYISIPELEEYIREM